MLIDTFFHMSSLHFVFSNLEVSPSCSIQSLLILFKADEFFIWSEEKPEYWADESLKFHGTSLVVQRLGFCAFIADGVGLIPGQGIKILWATQWAKNTNK